MRENEKRLVIGAADQSKRDIGDLHVQKRKVLDQVRPEGYVQMHRSLNEKRLKNPFSSALACI